MNIPKELKYTEEHEWIRIDGNTATIGITDFAQGELGDIVYIDIDSIGNDLDGNEIFGTVEAVKTVSDLFMPIKGKVLEINSDIESTPEIVNEDPYGKGWIIKIEIPEDQDISNLLSDEEYRNMIDN
ncbi:MAG: glycine cleavage system protein H [Flavobacteriaceae bacterium]|nr:glycine cleavage system protein H [Flavobacteriaceae bacterium]|tara:strand:- start:983 stop:1363 length:381 start_codon:yes stop_codon:yes gene_type:complete